MARTRSTGTRGPPRRASVSRSTSVSTLHGGSGGAETTSTGTAGSGIGKSALAIQVAHELVGAGAFPDGQLYVNLQGATPGLAPLEPLEALGRMLRALGVEPAQIPTEVEEVRILRIEIAELGLTMEPGLDRADE